MIFVWENKYFTPLKIADLQDFRRTAVRLYDKPL